MKDWCESVFPAASSAAAISGLLFEGAITSSRESSTQLTARSTSSREVHAPSMHRKPSHSKSCWQIAGSQVLDKPQTPDVQSLSLMHMTRRHTYGSAWGSKSSS